MNPFTQLLYQCGYDHFILLFNIKVSFLLTPGHSKNLKHAIFRVTVFVSRSPWLPIKPFQKESGHVLLFNVIIQTDAGTLSVVCNKTL